MNKCWVSENNSDNSVEIKIKYPKVGNDYLSNKIISSSSLYFTFRWVIEIVVVEGILNHWQNAGR